MKIIAVGLNYTTTLGLVRSIGETGRNVDLITLTKPGENIVTASKYVKNHRFSRVHIEEFFPVLEELRGAEERVLVIPAYDKVCMFLDQMGETLSEHYLFPNIRHQAGEVCAFMDKYAQKKLAMKCGLPVAEGFEYSTDEDGIQAACREAQYPCIVKPSASAFAMASKAAITRCDNRDALKKALEAAKEHCAENVVVERYINIDRELSAYGVAFEGKVTIPAYIVAITSGFGPHKGIAAEGEARPIEELGDLKSKLEEFVRRSGLNGLFCIDLLESGDTIYFSEMNLRAGASEYAVTAAGANLPGILIDAYDNRAEYSTEVRPVRFVNEKVVLDSYRGGHISWKEFLAALRNNEVGFVKNEQDPEPWKQFLKLLVRKMAARLIKGPQD